MFILLSWQHNELPRRGIFIVENVSPDSLNPRRGFIFFMDNFLLPAYLSIQSPFPKIYFQFILISKYPYLHLMHSLSSLYPLVKFARFATHFLLSLSSERLIILSFQQITKDNNKRSSKYSYTLQK